MRWEWKSEEKKVVIIFFFFGGEGHSVYKCDLIGWMIDYLVYEQTAFV